MGKKDIGKFIICFLLLVIFLPGCGTVSEENQQEITANQVYYSIRETAVPDPDEALKGELRKNGWVRELDSCMQNGNLYRIAQAWGTADGMDVTTGYYIQILEPPYIQWENYPVSSLYWDETLEFEGFQNQVWKVISADENNSLYCMVKRYDDALKEHAAVGLWHPEAPGSLQWELPEGWEDRNLYFSGDGMLYGYEGSRLAVLSDELQEPEEKILKGKAYGLLEDSLGGGILWYGEAEDETFGIWALEDGSAVLEGFQDIAFLNMGTFGLDVSGEGCFYLADTGRLWRFYEGEEPREVCDFVERGYVLNQVSALSVREDGSLALLTVLDGRRYILCIEESGKIPDEKQEITLGDALGSAVLREHIARFNRQSDKWYVTMVTAGEEETGLEFINRIQMEISAGRGPDLMVSDLLDFNGMAVNGYLHSLEGVLTDEDAFWTAMLDSGRVDGTLYALPYEGRLYFPSYSAELTGGRESWTLEEFMEAVRASDAEILQYGFSGMDIVLNYGLYDNDNRKLIDWENGESHLTEELFLELLKFAEEYADEGKIRTEDVEDALAEGRIAAAGEGCWCYSLDGFNYREACFGGNPANIGFPRAQGNGIYVYPRMLCLNENSGVKDGAEEFLRFLVSGESQTLYAEFEYLADENISAPGLNYWKAMFAVRKDALERQIELKSGEEEGVSWAKSQYGISYQPQGFSDVQKERFSFIVENARPGNWYIYSVLDMVYDELEPYFEGQRTAEEAAEILDNRIQLFLDER